MTFFFCVWQTITTTTWLLIPFFPFYFSARLVRENSWNQPQASPFLHFCRKFCSWRKKKKVEGSPFSRKKYIYIANKNSRHDPRERLEFSPLPFLPFLTHKHFYREEGPPPKTSTTHQIKKQPITTVPVTSTAVPKNLGFFLPFFCKSVLPPVPKICIIPRKLFGCSRYVAQKPPPPPFQIFFFFLLHGPE